MLYFQPKNKNSNKKMKCEKCQARFSTYEQVEILNRIVIKRDGTKETYSRNKIEEGIKRATNKRIDGENLKNLIDEIEAEINCEGKTEITSKKIGNAILNKLKKRINSVS